MYLKVKSDDVNGDDGLPGIVLQSSCEESLREEEPRDPEHRWDALVDPALDELHPLHQVQHPCCQGLQGGVSLGRERGESITKSSTHAGRFREGRERRENLSKSEKAK